MQLQSVTRRRAAALPIVVSVAVAALTACGSSTTGAQAGPSPAVKKEAGLFTKDVQLTIVNSSPKTIRVKFCSDRSPGDCPVRDIHPGATDVVQGDSLVTGSIDFFKDEPVVYPDGSTNWKIVNTVHYYAKNPDVGEPWVSVLSPADDPVPYSSDPGDIPKWRLVEGEAQTTTVGADSFSLERRGDSSDYKEMRLVATS